MATDPIEVGEKSSGDAATESRRVFIQRARAAAAVPVVVALTMTWTSSAMASVT